MIERYANQARTTLAGAVNGTAQVLSVTSLAGFPAAGRYRVAIDEELCLVDAVDVPASALGVVRGAEGTQATAHDAGAAVSVVLTRESLHLAARHMDMTTSNAALNGATAAARTVGLCGRSAAYAWGDLSTTVPDDGDRSYWPTEPGHTYLVEARVIAVAKANGNVCVWRLTLIIQTAADAAGSPVAEYVLITNGADSYVAGNEVMPNLWAEFAGKLRFLLDSNHQVMIQALNESDYEPTEFAARLDVVDLGAAWGGGGGY